MPVRKPKWWKLHKLILDQTDLDQEAAADLADTIWFFFGRKL